MNNSSSLYKRLINKKIVGQRFDRRAHEYDRYADIQLEMIRTLLKWQPVRQHMQICKMYTASYRNDKPMTCDDEPLKMLDIGCGTGALAEAAVSTLSATTALSLLDLSPRMLQEAQRKLLLRGYAVDNLQLIEADAEAWSAGVSSHSHTGYDFILSSAAFQWFNQPETTLRALCNRLQPDGMLAFATFMPGTVQQLHEACSYADSQLGFETLPRGQAYPTAADWQAWIGQNSSYSAWMEKEWTLTYDSVEEVLRRVRRIGASNALQQRSTPVSRKWLRLMKEYYYENFAAFDNGVRVTYRAGFGYIRNEEILN